MYPVFGWATGEAYNPHDPDRFKKIKVARREELVELLLLLSMIVDPAYSDFYGRCIANDASMFNRADGRNPELPFPAEDDTKAFLDSI